MAKSERPSMPIIEYISFGLDEAFGAFANATCSHFAAALGELAGTVSSLSIAENFASHFLALISSI